jgi:hypothetical protein
MLSTLRHFVCLLQSAQSGPPVMTLMTVMTVIFTDLLARLAEWADASLAFAPLPLSLKG